MNKKIGIFMVFVLLIGAVFLSACANQDAVGRRILDERDGLVNEIPKEGGSDDRGGQVAFRECAIDDDCEEGWGCVDGECVVFHRATVVYWDCDGDGEFTFGSDDTWTDCDDADGMNDAIDDGCKVNASNCVSL